MKPKVAIYGAGQYGLEAMRIMHQKGWEIVAAYNRAGEKVGRDVGELAGIERLGISVQDCETAQDVANLLLPPTTALRAEMVGLGRGWGLMSDIMIDAADRLIKTALH